MSDLAGFSAIAERLEPERVVELLNVYLGRMTDIVERYGGTVDEFIGDAVLAILGAPVAVPTTPPGPWLAPWRCSARWRDEHAS